MKKKYNIIKIFILIILVSQNVLKSQNSNKLTEVKYLYKQGDANFNCQLIFNDKNSIFFITEIENDNNENESTNFRIYDKNTDFIFTFLDSNIIFYTHKNFTKKFFTDSIIKDTVNLIEWKLIDNFKTINNLNCQKATSYYNGRNYIAWFCNDIQTKFGPYKFFNLPGLIIEIYDENKKYFFNALKINNLLDFDFNNYTNLLNKNKYLSRADFKKSFYLYFEDIKNKLLSKQEKDINTEVNINYDFIEKDILPF